jgi:KH domain
LKIVAKIKHVDDEDEEQEIPDFKEPDDLSKTTPYGKPSEDAFRIPVPKDCVGLVIGKRGETIRHLQEASGAFKVQVAADNAPGSEYRNVFVEGSDEACQKVNNADLYYSGFKTSSHDLSPLSMYLVTPYLQSVCGCGRASI